MNNRKDQVYIGISGGVDSSVAAHLLLEKGYRLIGFHCLFSDNPALEKKIEADLVSARQVASKLGIALEVIDLKKEFRDVVIKNYLTEYRQGRTPNPCVICNRELKFGLIKDKIKALGGGKLSTGHYVNLKNNQIYRGLDREKDQSYFLWSLDRDQLEDTIFPLGEIKKEKVKRIAQEIGLETHKRTESSGACFFPKGGHREFIEKNISQLAQPGKIVDKKGRVIGEHHGLGFYTIGQRYGFDIDPRKAGLNGKDIPPVYVTGVDPKNNLLKVGLEKELHHSSFLLSNPNWQVEKPFEFESITVQIRHLGKVVGCDVEETDSKLVKVEAEEDFRSITPGQSAVFYQDDLLLGGGIIERTND
jgi:tRNA-uridine 2-sulfurtransferase